MPTDRKYGPFTFPRGDIPDDEPGIWFRAQDETTPDVIEAAIRLAAERGSPPHHIEGLAATKAEVEAWQAENHTQVPQSAAQAP